MKTVLTYKQMLNGIVSRCFKHYFLLRIQLILVKSQPTTDRHCMIYATVVIVKYYPS